MIILAFAGCLQSGPGGEADVFLVVEPSKMIFGETENVTLNFSIRNQMDAPVEFVFTSTLRVSFTIASNDGEKVLDRPTACATFGDDEARITVDPGESELVHSTFWDLRIMTNESYDCLTGDNSGGQAGPGTYKVHATLSGSAPGVDSPTGKAAFRIAGD